MSTDSGLRKLKLVSWTLTYFLTISPPFLNPGCADLWLPLELPSHSPRLGSFPLCWDVSPPVTAWFAPFMSLLKCYLFSKSLTQSPCSKWQMTGPPSSQHSACTFFHWNYYFFTGYVIYPFIVFLLSAFSLPPLTCKLVKARDLCTFCLLIVSPVPRTGPGLQYILTKYLLDQ